MQRIVVLGSLNIDLVLPVDRLPRPGETLTGGDLALFEGGKGANQACAVGRLGGTATMIGQVGADPFATRLVDALRAAGVDSSGIGASGRPTGSACISVLPDGENTIVISPGANATLSPEIALERLRAAAPYGFLLAQLETPMATVVAAFAEAKRSGATTILDPAPVQPLPADLIPNVDFITPNPSGVAAVDPTAAGDTFNGAFAVSLAEGTGIEEAALFANAAAAISVTRPGAQNSVPARAEVEALLAARRKVACSR